MLTHNRSPWLTLMGDFQIIFAIPLAYFVYVFIAGLTFFPYLNFIGAFVDLCVVVDKFKNARSHNVWIGANLLSCKEKQRVPKDPEIKAKVRKKVNKVSREREDISVQVLSNL
jgi:hypothetical protein